MREIVRSIVTVINCIIEWYSKVYFQLLSHISFNHWFTKINVESCCFLFLLFSKRLKGSVENKRIFRRKRIKKRFEILIFFVSLISHAFQISYWQMLWNIFLSLFALLTTCVITSVWKIISLYRTRFSRSKRHFCLLLIGRRSKIRRWTMLYYKTI